MLKKFFKKEIHFIDNNNSSLFSYRLKGDILSISNISDSGKVLDTLVLKAGLLKKIKVRLYYALHFRN